MNPKQIYIENSHSIDTSAKNIGHTKIYISPMNLINMNSFSSKFSYS